MSIETNFVFPLVVLAAFAMAGCEVLLGVLATDGGTPLPVPDDLNSEREARGAIVITLIACAFLACAAAMLGLKAERQPLVVMPLASLVFCIWSGARVLLWAGGTRHPARMLIAHGAACVLICGLAGGMGARLLWDSV